MNKRFRTKLGIFLFRLAVVLVVLGLVSLLSGAIAAFFAYAPSWTPYAMVAIMMMFLMWPKYEDD